MKKGWLLLIVLCGWQGLYAQNAAEFFKQKKTQKKYLLMQIAALQSYIGLAAKGYAIAQDGLGFIADIKKGTFSLHKDYFHSLSTVGSAVRKGNILPCAIARQTAIIQLKTGAIHQLSSN